MHEAVLYSTPEGKRGLTKDDFELAGKIQKIHGQ